LIIVKDNHGNVYFPDYNFNSLGAFEIGKGYYVKTKLPISLELCGSYAWPEDHSIPLSAGWNIIGYLRLLPTNVEVVLSELNESNNLIVIKDYSGHLYLRRFNFNGLGYMQPGQGYQLKVHQADTLHYLSNTMEYRLASLDLEDNTSVHTTRPEFTDQNMTFVIEDDIWDQMPGVGSEIIAYDEMGKVVGSALYSSPTSVVTIWGDDSMTEKKEGLLTNESVNFMLWNEHSTADLEVVKWEEGSSLFQKDAINIAAAIKTLPSSGEILNTSRTVIEVVNVLGQRVNINDEPLKGMVLFEIYDDGSVEKIVK